MPARTFPDPLPDWVRSNPLRNAEVKVYDALRSQLSSRYVLFYSRPWIGTNHDGTEKEGEADFVVASAEAGFVVIEVKGGGVGRDGKTDDWFSVDREGRRHAIKDPVRQASRSKNELLERLRAHQALGGRWIGAGIAIVLPDSTGAEMLEGLSTPRDQFALRDQMEKLGRWVAGRLESTSPDGKGSLGEDGVATLERLLAPSFQLRIPLALSIDADHERVITVTEQQYALLEFLAGHKRAAISGAAGSGKTVLALHKAMELARENPGHRVLLTCYNAALASWLARSGRKLKNLYVMSFHGLCTSVAKDAGIPLGDGGQSSEYFNTTLPNALNDAVTARPELRFDAVVVDEGQDFSDEWLDALQLVLKHPDDTFWLFYDDNQRLYSRRAETIDGMPRAPFALRRNVRNPRPVFDRLLPLIGDAIVTPLGPQGRPVEEIRVDRKSLPAKLSSLIRRLTEDEQVDPDDIAVLVHAPKRAAEICPDRKFARVGTCRAEDEPLGRVCVDTVKRFKGLERKVIILVDPADVVASDEEGYVAISRATAHLVLLGDVMPPVIRQAEGE